ncbi:MAG: ABC transporter substrate-binding protein [Pseudomonadota bacterium]
MRKVLVVIVGLMVASVAIAADVSPDEFITDAVDSLAEQMDGRRDELRDDTVALYTMIDDFLLPRFDRRTAAQQVLAKHWRGADEDQRARFIEAFYTTLVQRYADGILEFEHDQIKVLPFRGDATKRRVMVKTRVELEDGTNVAVNYTLINKPDGWQMFDVTIEGVSYVRNFRAEFDSEINRTSLDAVIARLEAEVAANVGE